MSSLIHEVKKYTTRGLIAVILLAILVIAIDRYDNWIFVHGPDAVVNFVDKFGFFALPIFIILIILANIFLLPSHVLVFLAGLSLGTGVGLIVSSIALFLAATTNFYLGRKFGRTLRIHRRRSKRINHLREFISKHGFGLVFSLRYLGFYFSVVSYASGLAKIKYRKYVYGTVLGELPYVLIYVFAGSLLMDLKSSAFVYPYIIFKLFIFASFLAWYISWNRKQKKLFSSTS